MHGEFVQIWRINAAGDTRVNADDKVNKPVHSLSFVLPKELWDDVSGVVEGQFQIQAQMISNSRGSSSKVRADPLRQMNSPSAWAGKVISKDLIEILLARRIFTSG